MGNLVHKLTNEMLQQLSGQPPAIQVACVWLIYLAALSMLLSIPTSVANWKLLRVVYHLEDRIERLPSQSEVGIEQARKLVHREVSRMTVLAAAARSGARFGGDAVHFGPSGIYLRPRFAWTFGSVILSGVITLAGWPGRPSVGSLVGTVSAIPWHQVPLAWSICVILAGLLFVIPRTPMIDAVRARDESAKEAHRRLLEVAGIATDAYYAAAKWAETLIEQRRRLTAGRVEHLTSGSLTYQGGRLVELWPPMRTDVRVESDQLEIALSDLAGSLDGIRRAGLSFATFRISGSATPYLHVAGLDWLLRGPGERLRTEYCVMERAREIIQGHLDHSFAIDKDHWEFQYVETRARALDRQLLIQGVTTLFRAECLRMAIDQITRRSVGSAWIRLATAVQR